MNRRTRLLLSSLTLLVVLVGLPVVLIWRAGRQARLDRDLIIAVKQRHADAVVLLLNQGAHPNAEEYNEQMLSAWQAFRNLFTQFRHKNKFVEEKGDTALLLAVNDYPMKGEVPRIPVDPNIVQALLDAGADPNTRSHGGWTPLMGSDNHWNENVR